MDSLEQRIEKEGKALVKARTQVKLRFAIKRRDSLQLTANQINERLRLIDAEIEGHVNDLKNLGEPVIDTSEIPELDKDFFKNAILTRPGESLIKIKKED